MMVVMMIIIDGLGVVVLIIDSFCHHRRSEIRLLPGGCRTLAVGEGDFAFSEGLSASRSCTGSAPELVVTCLEPEEDIRSQYADADQRLARLRGDGAKVICGVDATELLKGPLVDEEPFERIVFNFPLLPTKVHKPRASSADVQIANRAMLVEFLRGAATFLRKDGLLLIANKDCYPYSWWRLESLPEWAGGQLAFMGAVPWQYTEYPSLYGGPCNVNRDASVKPTDATIFLYAHRDSENFRLALEAASSWRYCCDPGQSKQGPFSFRCDMCHVSTRTAGDLHAHEAGKIHKKRAHLERLWQ
ncbi:HIPP41, partial [Symbiodinium sp. CCMP2456]